MNYYQKLIEERNKLWTPKLEFGCLVEGKYGLEAIRHMTRQGAATANSFTGCYIEDLDGYIILGKELSLQDVLRMLSDKYSKLKHNKWENLNIGFASKELGVFTTEDGNNIEIDLSKPIQDQGEEVLRQIYELIK